MFTIMRTVLSGLPLLAFPAFAAGDRLQTGITEVGPAAFFFTLAGAALLTLVFRNTANHLPRLFANRLGQLRMRAVLRKCRADVLQDFILPGAYGGLTRVDYALLTPGGILCIQSKHYSGIVFGAEDEPQWTNIDSVKHRRFLNPLVQNEGHLKALQKVVPDVPIFNLVVFTGAVEFSTPPPKNVLTVEQLADTIAGFLDGPCAIDDWQAVWMNVKAAALTDEDTRKDFQAQLGFG